MINQLIEDLPKQARHRLLELCEPVELKFDQVLCEPNKPIRYVYFPLSGFVTLITTLRDHQPLEVGLIGNEGMVGVTLALGVSSSPMRAIVHGAGTALRISAADIKRELLDNPVITGTLNRYLYLLLAQLAQTAACAHFHEIEPRLARWLLMTHDRVHTNKFHFTQELLADMLGVRRSGISIAARNLQNKNIIDYSRGNICVLDRHALEAAACECYIAASKSYEKLFEHKTPNGLNRAS